MKLVPISLVLSISAAAVCGCWRGAGLGGQGGNDGDTSGDTDSWPGTDGEDVLVPVEEGLLDSSSNLVWQNPPLFDLLPWKDADQYCEDLVAGGKDDWRLPDIDELKTLIRGCDTAQCDVTDPGCLQLSCKDSDPDCDWCVYGAGPGGCYWHPALQGWCEVYWSSSPSPPQGELYWHVSYLTGGLSAEDRMYTNAVRCVR